jgi:8-hydroxy-5-deazaflavin:NADPH oxidoreductase
MVVITRAGSLGAKVLISCSLPINMDDTALIVGQSSSGAEEVAARLIRDVGFDPVDAGPLRVARYTEPFSLLIAQLAYEGGGSPQLAYRFARFWQ